MISCRVLIEKKKLELSSILLTLKEFFDNSVPIGREIKNTHLHWSCGVAALDRFVVVGLDLDLDLDLLITNNNSVDIGGEEGNDKERGMLLVGRRDTSEWKMFGRKR